MVRKFLATLIIISTVFAACRSGAVSTRPAGRVLDRANVHQAIVGCYAFFDRNGRPASDSLSWAPATARLFEGGRAQKLTPGAHPVTGAGRLEPTWRIDPATDTVHLIFSTGFSGTQFRLGFHQRRDTLWGRAVTFIDVGPPFSTEEGSAFAVRVPCPSTG
jgi:hypothetical protein